MAAADSPTVEHPASPSDGHGGFMKELHSAYRDEQVQGKLPPRGNFSLQNSASRDRGRGQELCHRNLRFRAHFCSSVAV